MSIEIREIVDGDLLAVLEMIREFARYEDLVECCDVTEDDLRSAFFSDHPVTEGIIATAEGEPVGYAIYYPNFSSFRGQRGMYLEDIFVRDVARGTGVGIGMLAEIARITLSRGFERIDFNVLEWNTPASDFYFKHGAVRNDDERHFKFDGEALTRLSTIRVD